MIRALFLSLLLASTASAAPRVWRQVPPPTKPTCAPKVIIVVPVYKAPRPVIDYGGGWHPYW